MQVSTTFQGPLPPPDILAHYERIVPGAAARIMDMFEKQVEHRQSLERTVVEHDLAQARRGLNFCFVFTPACLILAAAFVFTGHDAAGGAILTTTIVAVATALIYGTRRREKQLEEKKRLRGDL